MRASLRALLVFGLFFWLLTPASAQDSLLRLSNNPFNRPAVLNQPPPPPPAPVVRPVVVPPEEVELELTATLVSKTAPMVVVDGELLGIGEKIEGLKLIAVMEGKAIFARGRKKFSFSIADEQQK